MPREVLDCQEQDTIRGIHSLCVYRRLQRDEVLSSFQELLELLLERQPQSLIVPAYSRFVGLLLERAESLGLTGPLFGKYLLHLFLNDENIFSLGCERKECKPEGSLNTFALEDMRVLLYLVRLDVNALCANLGGSVNMMDYKPMAVKENPYLEQLACCDTPEKLLESFRWYYANRGVGSLSQYTMFRFDEKTGLLPIQRPDAVSFAQIIGYAAQKQELKNNTLAFINKMAANNVLLVGSRGTGKSSCVKALANEYAGQGLRIVEITKEQIPHMPALLQLLNGRGFRFIVFLDDLSFDEFEGQYKYLKSVLEGGAETRPENVLFYATSNRRHLVQEKWSDKKNPDGDEELHTSDTVNEKLSLSDRFGVTITFPKPTPEEYLNIVTGLAQMKNLVIDRDFLQKQAMAWELSQKGLSGRTARQFIDSIVWEFQK